MSICQTSMRSFSAAGEADLRVCRARMRDLACSPLAMPRQAKISFDVPSACNLAAVSKPRPTLAPVTMTVFPLKEVVGLAGGVREWSAQ